MKERFGGPVANGCDHILLSEEISYGFNGYRASGKRRSCAGKRRRSAAGRVARPLRVTVRSDDRIDSSKGRDARSRPLQRLVSLLVVLWLDNMSYWTYIELP
jgi:hypothetical protein